ncbi:hypothetical protein ACS0TY_008785 [Phlomoides rotata]
MCVYTHIHIYNRRSEYSNITTVMSSCRGKWVWWLRLIVGVAAVWELVNSQPQTNLLSKGCSQYDPTNSTVFFGDLNATLTDLRRQLSGGGGRWFATAQREDSVDPVYAMAQCRAYMTEADCLACYDFAVSQIRNCTTVGARLDYDGCFLRYESYNFFTQTIENTIECGSRSAPQPITFKREGQTLLSDLQTATPNINGYFAATKRSASNLIIYGVAQCVPTVSPGGCQGCLTAAYEAIQDCLASADARVVDAACFLRYSDTPFFSDNQTTDITAVLRRGEGGNSSNDRATIGGVVGGASLVIILLASLLWYSRKATRGNILGATELQRPIVYNYKDLKAATNNFSEDYKLGEGSFGAVYRATLKNGTTVAVKKLNISYSRAKADFESEGRLISNVHHRNLVRLLGCCSKGSELLLIYEYMENGSLDRFLYGDKRGSLTWKQRFDIIFGTARGIAYLHEHYHVTIIHRDIKPSNILLDDAYQAKIADFGLARLLPEDQTHVSTRFAGTLGYTAPEYAINGHLSEKVDTYSFGVVILEIISGRRCSDMINSETGYLLEEARNLYKSGVHQNVADEALDSNEYNIEDMKKLVEIALICTQSPPSSRPTMSEIVAMILSEGLVEQKISSMSSSAGETSWIDTGSSASNATNSISHFTGR